MDKDTQKFVFKPHFYFGAFYFVDCEISSKKDTRFKLDLKLKDKRNKVTIVSFAIVNRAKVNYSQFCFLFFTVRLGKGREVFSLAESA